MIKTAQYYINLKKHNVQEKRNTWNVMDGVGTRYKRLLKSQSTRGFLF